MIDQELLEHVARAICIATGMDPDRKGNETEYRWQEFGKEAQAAIEAVDRFRGQKR